MTSWRDNLLNKTITMPEDSELIKTDYEKKESKFLGVGKHSVKIQDVELVVASSGSPYLKLLYTNSTNQTIKGTIFLFRKDGEVNKMFYLLIRSMVRLSKPEQSEIIEFLLSEDDNIKQLVGMPLQIRVKYGDEGVLIKYDADIKKYLIVNVKDNSTVFSNEFASVKEAKAYIETYNMTNEDKKMNLKIAYPEVYGFDPDETLTDEVKQDVVENWKTVLLFHRQQQAEKLAKSKVTLPPRVKA